MQNMQISAVNIPVNSPWIVRAVNSEAECLGLISARTLSIYGTSGEDEP